jgi:hypothetical protein
MKHVAVDLHNDRHEFEKLPDPETQIALASPGNQPAPRKAALHDELGGERKLMLQNNLIRLSKQVMFRGGV